MLGDSITISVSMNYLVLTWPGLMIALLLYWLMWWLILSNDICTIILWYSIGFWPIITSHMAYLCMPDLGHDDRWWQTYASTPWIPPGVWESKVEWEDQTEMEWTSERLKNTKLRTWCLHKHTTYTSLLKATSACVIVPIAKVLQTEYSN